MRWWLAGLMAWSIGYCSNARCFGQEVERSQLPIPDAPFEGKIGKSFEDSKQDYPQPVTPPKGAPNVVLILIDDLGIPIYQRSHNISAALDIGNNGADGAIVAEGGSSGGYALYVKDGKLVYEYNFFGKERYTVTSDSKLPGGNVEVTMDYVQKPGKDDNPSISGSVTLKVNWKKVAEGELKNVVPSRFSATETLDIGSHLGSTVSESYVAPHTFSGKIKKVDIELK